MRDNSKENGNVNFTLDREWKEELWVGQVGRSKDKSCTDDNPGFDRPVFWVPMGLSTRAFVILAARRIFLMFFGYQFCLPYRHLRCDFRGGIRRSVVQVASIILKWFQRGRGHGWWHASRVYFACRHTRICASGAAPRVKSFFWFP